MFVISLCCLYLLHRLMKFIAPPSPPVSPSLQEAR